VVVVVVVGEVRKSERQFLVSRGEYTFDLERPSVPLGSERGWSATAGRAQLSQRGSTVTARQAGPTLALRTRATSMIPSMIPKGCGEGKRRATRERNAFEVERQEAAVGPAPVVVGIVSI
jgi:hypothetical protein